jgi:hypothetical protein
MNSIARKLNYCARNADVQEEFIGIMKNPLLKDYWENYIKRRLKTGIIGKYLKLCTAEDILGELTLKIFETEIVWNRNVYKNFKHFMYGQIQNSIRDIERKLKIKIEELRPYEEDEVLYTAEPRNEYKHEKIFVELNAHNIGKDLMDKEDKYAHYKSHFEEQFDPEKFNETVLVILKRPEDTELLAVYTGYINKKKRKDVMEEYGLNIQEYKKIWKRLLYKLRNELPKEYKNMLSISMVMHLAYNCFRNIPSMFL